eukprot:TRINITY_DN11658_c0_g1_i3.p1 TRINITY_DN11658_c0_g1~~TRINITY_DN11658_c0_g1_i3.p1  ORF type:complete len:456 (-),score=134.61 TRINITY_DN11658_c0_g1_i3:631-1998(-)
MKEGLTFDDALLVPRQSPVRSRKEISLRTRFSRRVTINNPIVSANMDTVTEDAMAIAVAQNGGIGVIHRFNTVEQQVAMVKRVKRAESYVISDPYTASPEVTVAQMRQEAKLRGVGGFLIVNETHELLGVVSTRDTLFAAPTDHARDVMTPRDHLVVAPPDVSMSEARQLLHQHRKEISLRTRFSRRVTINNPIVSANMDTVTEDAMAIAVAQNGGIGVIHRFNTVEQQVAMVKRVKRAESYVISDPYTASPEVTVAQMRQEAKLRGVGGFLIVNETHELLGVVSTRDTLFAAPTDHARDVMTPRDHLVVAPPDVSMSEARQLLHQHRKEKLPLVNDHNCVCGLITSKDILNHEERPFASLDGRGQLLVAAAVGVKADDVARAEALAAAGADAVVVDVAHGHSDICIEQVTCGSYGWHQHQANVTANRLGGCASCCLVGLTLWPAMSPPLRAWLR